MSSVAQRIRAEARMFDLMPEPDCVCVCGHRGDAHVFSTAEGEPVYVSCFKVTVERSLPSLGYVDSKGRPISATCDCSRFQALQDSRC